MLNYAEIARLTFNATNLESLQILGEALNTKVVIDSKRSYAFHTVAVWKEIFPGLEPLLLVEICEDRKTREESVNRVVLASEEEWQSFFMKDRQILNLTQHKASLEQVETGVVEPCCKEVVIDLLTFKGLPTKEDILERAEQLAEIAKEYHYSKVMIGGALWLMGPLEEALKKRGIQPLYAYSKRDCVEEPQEDGSVKKTMVFKHLGFIEA